MSRNRCARICGAQPFSDPAVTMLLITQQQIESLDAVIGERFQQRMLRLVTAHFPVEVAALGPATADAAPDLYLVEQLLRRAEAMDITANADLAAFAVLMMSARQLTTDAPALLAWIRSILLLEDLSGRGKMFLMREGLDERAPLDRHAATLCTRIDVFAESMW